jgi:uncharacterized protein (DUF58 family)
MTSMAKGSPVASILTGDIVERIKQLELFSRLRVEGALAGENRSPFKGFSSDFLQHREYNRGDNLKYLDWRVYGKTDKLYIKEFEHVTNAPVNLIVDISASMDFQGEGFSKHEFTVRCAGLLAYLMFIQRDDFGLFLFNDSLVEHIRPASSSRHLNRVFERLVSITPAGETDFKQCLFHAEARASRRGLVAVLSDFMDDPAVIARGLGRFRMEGHDVIAFQVYDELESELQTIDFTRFRDLETEEITAVDPLLIRDEYRRQFLLHQHDMKSECLRHGVDHVLLPVSDDFDRVMGDYLRRRMALML